MWFKKHKVVKRKYNNYLEKLNIIKILRYNLGF